LVGQTALQQLCRDAESESLTFLRELQKEEHKAQQEHHSAEE
jgi:hypothetical protein